PSLSKSPQAQPDESPPSVAIDPTVILVNVVVSLETVCRDNTTLAMAIAKAGVITRGPQRANLSLTFVWRDAVFGASKSSVKKHVVVTPPHCAKHDDAGNKTVTMRARRMTNRACQGTSRISEARNQLVQLLPVNPADRQPGAVQQDENGVSVK